MVIAYSMYNTVRAIYCDIIQTVMKRKTKAGQLTTVNTSNYRPNRLSRQAVGVLQGCETVHVQHTIIIPFVVVHHYWAIGSWLAPDKSIQLMN